MSKQATKPEKPLSKKSPDTTSAPNAGFLFEKRNYFILLAGIFLLAIGFMLMMGGSQPPDQFDPKVIYGFRVTTLSSIVVVAGLLVVLYSIFAKHNKLPS